MIKYLDSDKCITCNLCVKVCPTNVFDKVTGSQPVIARQEDCQTCFMCELYCPADALYVSPLPDNTAESLTISREEEAFLGSYRLAVGWGKDQETTAVDDLYHELKK